MLCKYSNLSSKLATSSCRKSIHCTQHLHSLSSAINGATVLPTLLGDFKCLFRAFIRPPPDTILRTSNSFYVLGWHNRAWVIDDRSMYSLTWRNLLLHSCVQVKPVRQPAGSKCKLTNRIHTWLIAAATFLVSTYHPQAPFKNGPSLICLSSFMPLCLMLLGLTF